MNNSHLLGLLTFGAFALFALLTWTVAARHPEVTRDPALRRRTRVTAVCLLLGGAVFALYAFLVDSGLRATTLHEEMVDGGAGERTVPFSVEHPGVAHELFLSPTSDPLRPPAEDAQVVFSLRGPAGEVVLPEQTGRFGVRAGTRGQRADWQGRTYPFTPSAAGPHEVRVRTLTAGVPRVHVRVVDPLKRDGQRMPGY